MVSALWDPTLSRFQTSKPPTVSFQIWDPFRIFKKLYKLFIKVLFIINHVYHSVHYDLNVIFICYNITTHSNAFYHSIISIWQHLKAQYITVTYTYKPCTSYILNICYSYFNHMLDPGARISLVRDGQIVVRGNQYVVFTYVNTYTIIGSDDQGETTFGIYYSHLSK